ncbi:MAG: hypothetical protein RL329_506 [Bacteroidota bacterium]|jgi:hypothetical protein
MRKKKGKKGKEVRIIDAVFANTIHLMDELENRRHDYTRQQIVRDVVDELKPVVEDAVKVWMRQPIVKDVNDMNDTP